MSITLEATFDQGIADRIQSLIAAFAMTPDCTFVIGKPESTPHFRWGNPDTVSIPSSLINEENKEYALYVTLHEICHLAVSVPYVLPAWFSRDPQMHVIANVLEDLKVDCRCALEYPGATPWIAACANKVLEQVLDEDQDAEPCPILGLLFGLITRLWSGVMPELHEDSQRVMTEIWPAVLRSTTIVPEIGPVDPGKVERLFDLHQVSLHPATKGMDYWQMNAAMHQLDWFNYFLANIWPPIRCLIEKYGTKGLERLSNRLRGMEQSCGVGSSSETRRTKSTPATGDKPYMTCIHKHHRQIEDLQQILIDRFESNQNQKFLDRQPVGERLNMKQLLRFESGERQVYDQLFMQKIQQKSTSVSIYVLVDRSSSMNTGDAGRRIAAFESAVVITDTAKRLGIPGHVYLFDTELRHYLSTDEIRDDTYRQSMSGLASKCEGNTNLAAALQKLDGILSQDMADNILCLVLTDEDVPTDQLDFIRLKLNRWKISGFKTAVFQMHDGEPTNGFVHVKDTTNLPGMIARVLDRELVA